MKNLIRAAILALLATCGYAETTKTVFNPFTGRLDFITSLQGNTWPANGSGCLGNDGAGNLSWVACSGGSSSAAGGRYAIQISSPAATFAGSQNFTYTGSSVSLRGTFYNLMDNSGGDNPAILETTGQPSALTLFQNQYLGNYGLYMNYAWATLTNYKGRIGMEMYDFLCADGVTICASFPFVWKMADGVPAMTFDQNKRFAGGNTWQPSTRNFNIVGEAAFGVWSDTATAPTNGLMVSGNEIFGADNSLSRSTTAQMQVISSTANVYSFVAGTQGGGAPGFDFTVSTTGVATAALLTISSNTILPGTTFYANGAPAQTDKLTVNTQLTVPVSAGANPTANGQIAYDSTGNTLVAYNGAAASTQALVGTLFSFAPLADIMVSTTNVTAEVAFTSQYTFPANFFSLNRTIRLHLGFDHIATATIPTSTIKIRLQKSGPVNANIWTGNAQANAAAAAYNQRSAGVFIMTCTATGASGSMQTTAFIQNAPLAVTLLSAVSSFDTTAVQTLQVTNTFSASSASNITRLANFTGEVLK